MLYFYKNIYEGLVGFISNKGKKACYSTMSSHLNLDYLEVWSPWVLVFKLTFDVYMKGPKEIKDL